MRRIREVLRLRYECGLQQRLISASVGISKGSVSDYLSRAAAAGVTWAEASALDEDEIERRLFTQVGRNEPPVRVPIDFEWVHRELRRTGVTLQLLWVEYRDAALTANRCGRPYQYSQFCDLYADFRAKVEVSMRQVHRAGEKAFLDCSGKRPVIVDRSTGEVLEVAPTRRCSPSSPAPRCSCSTTSSSRLSRTPSDATCSRSSKTVTIDRRP